jgi:hypothetical protein
MSREKPNTARPVIVTTDGTGPEYPAVTVPQSANDLDDELVWRLMQHGVWDNECQLHPATFTWALWRWDATAADFAVIDKAVLRICTAGIPGPAGLSPELIRQYLWVNRGWNHGEPFPSHRPCFWWPGDGPVGKPLETRSVQMARPPRFGRKTCQE